MVVASIADLHVSRVTLGTVQFGMPYGIANRSGQPAYETVREIVRVAYEGGVTCLDTAAGYGESEEILGRVLADLGIAREVVVVTKIRHLRVEAAGERHYRAMVRQSVAESLRRLRLEALPVCLLHREEDFAHVAGLLALRERGLLRHVGCSVMTPGAASEIVRTGHTEALQAPTNLLDHRFSRGSVIALAAERGVAVFVRSVYLQGLMHLRDADIHADLRSVCPVLRALRHLAGEAGVSLTEMAARYPLGLAGVTSVLIGVETVAQMRENLALFARGPLSPDLMRAIADVVPDVPDAILMPNLWPRHGWPAPAAT